MTLESSLGGILLDSLKLAPPTLFPVHSLLSIAISRCISFLVIVLDMPEEDWTELV
jgi:hypothetical protein